MFSDTITAISTPMGEGGIGIVRMSGPDAFRIARKIFFTSKSNQPDFPRSHFLYHGYIVDGQGDPIDEVLLSFMKAPHTYTREDTVEINCHSGVFTLRLILDLTIKNGARLAEPGEFTRRAFLNGRIDLSRAESILHVIRARSAEGVKQAALNLQGRLYRKTTGIRDSIITTLARVDAVIDFPEDVEADLLFFKQVKDELEAISRTLQELIATAERGRAYREGIDTAIVGRPNVGKSSLLNALLRQQRAIVHDMPGTTRDLLEGYLLIGGYPLRLIDTAGIHDTANPVEQIGITRTKEAVAAARLLLVVLDGSQPLQKADEAVMDLVAEEHKLIIVVNKKDLKPLLNISALEQRFPGVKVVRTAAIAGEGIQLLEESIVELLDQSFTSSGEPAQLLSMRHEIAAKEALVSVKNAIEACESRPLEFVSLELREAWHKLGEITGDTVDDQLLDKIFSEFCIGK
ncbi:MAG: tRNA uridine-5-carboxymethylaminomethyl(34) synthesis GTPase MnmE [Firmicutes bacterium]|nr:tRNA uridine-5-carboxymethylaminomethyl(34) synthesis GTPase MnmE [Bacillota bacterium]HHX74496.1 tRNA uridine-5-carboxymethylaminomethyl(34) synthesis GTPase MnmE [Bacillota bacterium]